MGKQTVRDFSRIYSAAITQGDLTAIIYIEARNLAQALAVCFKMYPNATSRTVNPKN